MNKLGARAPTGANDPEVEAIGATFGVTGEAAARAQRTDWAQTALGPVRQWPAAMRTAVRLAMDSPQPVTVYLGDQMVIVQNDAVLAVNDQRARDASGHAAIAAYPELREYFEQMAARVRTGEAAQEPTVLIPRGIDGRMIDFWYHTAAAPIRDNGAIIGIYQVWLERTHEVLAARRLHVVNALSGQPARRSRRDAIEQSVGILSDAPDILFAAGYLIDLTASERISSRWPASTRAVRSRHRRLLAGDLRCGHWLLQRLFGTTAFRHVERHADHESATVVEGFRRQ